MKILRDHNLSPSQDENKWYPSKGSFKCICIHAIPLFVVSQSTAAIVSHLLPEIQTHWLTGTSATCTSLFKPVFVEGGLPDIGPPPTNKYDPESLWWHHELIHRAILADYSKITLLRPDIENFEQRWLKEVKNMIQEVESHSYESRREYLREISDQAFKEAFELERKWIEKLKEPSEYKRKGGILYRKYWRNENKKAGFQFWN